jgi:signal transduction histidine kinase
MGVYRDLGRYRWLGYGGVLILAGLEINEVLNGNHRALFAAGTVAVTAVIAAAWIPLMFRFQRDRSSPIGPVLIGIIAIASILLDVLTPAGAAIIGAIVALATAANRLSPRAGGVFAVVFISAYVVATALVIGIVPITLFSIGLGLAFAYIASNSVARLREEEAKAKALLAELQATRDAQLQSAALNERNRIAREIHDVLAHTLAALAVQLESARVLLQQPGNDAEALATVDRSHRLAREGLDEVRRAVSALRGERVPGPGQLRELVSEFETDTGVEADFRVQGESPALSSEAQLALYRTAQEALTNVRNHADASRVEVMLRYETGGTELQVIDVGTPKVPDENGGGYGLMGMRERAELLGGTLDAGPTNDGYKVRLWIPAAG